MYICVRACLVGTAFSQPREPWIKTSRCRFDAWAFSFTELLSSSLSCINEYLAIGTGGGGIIKTNSFRAEIAAWLDFSIEVKMVFS